MGIDMLRCLIAAAALASSSVRRLPEPFMASNRRLSAGCGIVVNQRMGQASKHPRPLRRIAPMEHGLEAMLLPSCSTSVRQWGRNLARISIVRHDVRA